MFNLFNKVSTKLIFLFIGLDILMGAGVIVLYVFSFVDQTVFTILLFVCIILLSFFTSALTQRHFQKKLDAKRNVRKYSFHGTKIGFDNPTKVIDLNYGEVQIKLESDVVYNLTIVYDGELFFSKEQEAAKYKIDPKKYHKTIQFFVFTKKDEALFRKVSILNYQATKFYVGSFFIDYEKGIFTQTDDVAPNEEYKEIYTNFLEFINCSVKEEK